MLVELLIIGGKNLVELIIMGSSDSWLTKDETMSTVFPWSIKFSSPPPPQIHKFRIKCFNLFNCHCICIYERGGGGGVRVSYIKAIQFCCLIFLFIIKKEVLVYTAFVCMCNITFTLACSWAAWSAALFHWF